MKLTDKQLRILLIAFHAVMLPLFVCIVISGVQLRWHLGYVIFWLAALSGIGLYFIHWKKHIWNAMIKLYAVCWGILSVLGGLITYLTYGPVYCETDKYIMKDPSEIFGFDSAILYEKRGLLEIEKKRYQGVYLHSMVPLDSIGAIVIRGDFANDEGLESGVAIRPLDDSFDKDKAKQYARNHNIEYGR